MTKDMTRGNPAKMIILFTLPLLLGNLFQQFYNMADTFIVGRTIGVHALAAVGSTGGATGKHRDVGGREFGRRQNPLGSGYLKP